LNELRIWFFAPVAIVFGKFAANWIFMPFCNKKYYAAMRTCTDYKVRVEKSSRTFFVVKKE